jgi:8-oxo-dGTP pyrophosphatase MutT (NUDIX family)
MPADALPLVERTAVRALILTPDADVLMMRIRSPNTGAAFWILPGGGLDPGESDMDGLARELREELGLEAPTVGPLLWRRQHTFDWREARIRQTERIYAVHAPRFVPRMSDALELTVLQEFRWWTPAGLAATDEPLTPRALAAIVSGYLADGPPVAAPALEVVVD